MQQKVMLIILDSAEKTLIDQWMDDGTLPNLARLREQGAYGALASLTQVMNATTWPTFTTGVWPGDHGISHYLMWRPDKMSFQRPTADWLGHDPFWHPLTARGRNVIALDIPYSHMAIHPPRGVELRSWGTHYKFEPPNTHPPELMHSIAQQYGREALGPQQTGLKSTNEMLKLRAHILDSVGKQRGATRDIMRSYPWDLLTLNIGAPHVAGHDFWDASSLLDTPSAAESERIATTIRDVYRASDAAVGELLDSAESPVTVLIVSLYGMGANNSLADVLPAMLGRVLGDTSDAVVKSNGMLHKVRERVPNQWRSAVKSRLPANMQDWLSAYWRGKNRHDWQTTQAFCPLPDYQGFVRLNVQGREAKGIVAVGEEYDRLWHTISSGLQSFVDVATGRPIIDAINTPDQLFAPGEHLFLLPDLIVQWSDIKATSVNAVTSPQFGTVPWPTPGRIPDGQSGHHVSDGWLMAVGSNITPGSAIETAHMIDIPPTLYHLLNEPIPAHFGGTRIPFPGGLNA